ncbi:hypothetical protein EKK58_08560 [Candidatus Dependentiae bacterium]|nr:MAG: hypothetical protein EKK58_08560 [Candidatus Dependentiae bacterium]
MTSRTIWSDNGTLKDLSVTLGNFKSGTQVIPYVSAEDYIYLGSDFAFNHRYIDVSVVNAVPANLTVELWDGDEWILAEDVIDQTSVSGVPFAQSGIISWTPNDDEMWQREHTNDDGDQITGLTGLKIRDMFWVRMKWSADLTSTFALKFIGHKFSNDDDLEVFYPDLNRTAVKHQFKENKADWNLQHIQAAEEIIKDLKKNRIIKSENQLLNWELFRDAAVHKVAEIAFHAFGKDFYENRDASRAIYKIELDKAIYHVDQNQNARLDVKERVVTQGKLYR